MGTVWVTASKGIARHTRQSTVRFNVFGDSRFDIQDCLSSQVVHHRVRITIAGFMCV